MNWLRVLGTAELPPIDQGVRQPFHAKMPLLQVCNTTKHPLECLLPRQGPIDTRAPCLERVVAHTLSSPLRGLALTSLLVNGGDHAGIDPTRARVRGITCGVESQICPWAWKTDRVGAPLQASSPLRKPPGVGASHGRQGAGSEESALGIGQGDHLLPLRRCIARIPHALAPFFAPVGVPSPCRTRPSSFFSSARGPTLAMKARWSDPSAAHWATALSTVVSWMAGWP
jgi:hypothetical protein